MVEKTQTLSVAVGHSVVEEMRPSLLKYFRRKTGSSVEAEDLTQDVMVQALSHATWASEAQAKGYIFRTAVNRWRDLLRRRRIRGVRVAWDDEHGQEATGSIENPQERGLIVREELEGLLCALEQLNPRTRTVLILIKVENVKIASVAEMLGISTSAVNKHLAKAVACLARMRSSEPPL
jgi:RNA polymerase sigma factor (sigma-70 family)